jgi:hypothetical protein
MKLYIVRYRLFINSDGPDGPVIEVSSYWVSPTLSPEGGKGSVSETFSLEF